MALSVNGLTSGRSQNNRRFTSRSSRSRGPKTKNGPQPDSLPGIQRFDVPWNVIAMDFGTETYSASRYFLEPDEPFEKSKIDRVILDNCNFELTGPTIAAWHQPDGESNDRWIIGKELEQMLQEVPPDKIIRQFKLALYDPHRESFEVLKMNQQLAEAGQNLHQLLTAFLRYFWHEVWTYVDQELFPFTARPDLSETLVYITVPMLVTPKATEKLRDAAKEAGMPNVAFLHESLCAGASVLDEVLSKGLEVPDTVLVKLMARGKSSLHQMLKVVGQPSGVRCGSSSIDTSFQQWMQREWPKKGEFSKVAKRLGFTENYILQKATIQFQKHKKMFPKIPSGGLDDIYIYPKNNKGTGVGVRLDHQQKQSFFDPHIRKIIALVRSCIRDDTKFIFLTGGLSANAYFCQKLRTEFGSRLRVVLPTQDWSECPVARGAQMMEHTLDLSKIPSLYSLGILFDAEEFDRKLHPDAVDEHGNPKDELVFEDFWTSTEEEPYDVVHNRIRWLLEQRDATASAKGVYKASKKLPQHFHIRRDCPKFTITVVFTRNATVQEHAPLNTASGDIHPDFEVETKTFDLPPHVIKELEDNGWVQDLSPGKDDQGRPLEPVAHLVFFCRVTLRHDNMSIDVGYEILDPKRIPWRTEKKPTQKDLMGRSLKSNWVTVWGTDTHVLKTSLPNASTPSHTSTSTPSQTQRVIRDETDNAVTRVSRRLNAELEQPSESPDDNISLAKRAVLNASRQRTLAEQSTNAHGQKRKSQKASGRSAKRVNRGPQQMSEPAVNSRASAAPSTVFYEIPSLSRRDLNFFSSVANL